MSHELDDNKERRERIIAVMPITGMILEDLIKHIMQYGYNLRGAREKVRELTYGGFVIIKGNKYYPIRTVVRERTNAEKDEKI